METAPTRSSKAPTVLIVIATVLAVISSITTWVHTDALDTDAWVNTSEELLNNEEVTTAVATYLVNELYTQVDVPGELEQLLPGDLSGVAAALSGALREPVTNGIERVLESPQFAEIWVRANRLAHEALVAILRDETLPAVSTADGTVTLDLREAIVNVGTEIGLPQTALDRIPEGAGQITIFQSEELKDVQNYVRVLDFLSWFLFLLTVGLYVLAVYLAAPRRRRALSMVGWSLVAYGVSLYVLTGLGVRTGIDYYVDDNDEHEPRQRHRDDRHRPAPPVRPRRHRVRRLDHRVRCAARTAPLGGRPAPVQPDHDTRNSGRWRRGAHPRAAVVEPGQCVHPVVHRLDRCSP